MGGQCSRYSALVAKVEAADLVDPEAFYQELDETLNTLIQRHKRPSEEIVVVESPSLEATDESPREGEDQGGDESSPVEPVMEEDSTTPPPPVNENPHNLIDVQSTEPREQCRVWIEQVLGESLPVLQTGECTDAQMWLHLRSGVLLCRLVNAIRPNVVPRVNTCEAPFSQRENVAEYLRAAGELGVVDEDRFGVEDLYSAHSMKQVYICILALSNASRDASGFSGPFVNKPRHPRPPVPSPSKAKRVCV